MQGILFSVFIKLTDMRFSEIFKKITKIIKQNNRNKNINIKKENEKV